MWLVADVGATKADVALFEPERGPRDLGYLATLECGSYDSLVALLRAYLQAVEEAAGGRVRLDGAYVAVAGPVVDGRASITNLGWTLAEQELRSELGLYVTLLNDLEATGYAVTALRGQELVTLDAGQPAPRGAIAVIAPGTGLGEAFLTWGSDGYVVHATEGGHVDFAPRNELQMRLLRDLAREYEHVSYERVISGLGLRNIYEFLKREGYDEPQWLAQELAAAPDANPVILAGALPEGDDSATERRCELCVATVELFAAVLAAEAGNLALKVLATGGIYLGGGMSRRMLPFLQAPSFLHELRAKGRLSELLGRVPVHVIVHPHAALMGAAAYGMRMM